MVHCVYTVNHKKRGSLFFTMTYHVRPHQPIIDQQGLGLRGLVHKEAYPVIGINILGVPKQVFPENCKSATTAT